jgi:PAS domain S-box-containing protein
VEPERSHPILSEIAEAAKVVAAQLDTLTALQTALIENDTVPIVGADSNSIITDWNAGAAKVFGWGPGEAIGQSLVNLLIPEEFRVRHLLGMEVYKKTGTGPVIRKSANVSALTKSGAIIDVAISVWPVPGGNKGVERFIAIINPWNKPTE